MYYKIDKYYLFIFLSIQFFIDINIYSQGFYVKNSVCGSISATDYAFDKEGNLFSIVRLDLPDSLWLNNSNFDVLPIKPNNSDFKTAVLSKFNKRNDLLSSLQIYGTTLEGVSIKLDEFGSCYIVFSSGSDSLYINNNLKTDKNFKNSLILMKFDSNLNFLKLKVIKNVFPLKPEILVSNDAVVIVSAYRRGILRVDNDSLVCPPFSEYDFFICNLNYNFDTINYLKSVAGKGYEFVYDVKLDARGNVYFCGVSTGSAYLIVGSDSFKQSNSKYPSNYFIGKLNKTGSLDWLNQSPCGNFDKLTSITISKEENLIVTGIFSSSEITFGTQVLYNPYINVNGNSSFLLILNKNGEITKINEYWKNGRIDLYELKIDYNQKIWAYFVAWDSLYDSKGNSYYGGTYFCELDNNFDISSASYFSSSKGCSLLNTYSNWNNELFMSIYYSDEDTLLFNGLIAVDKNERKWLKILLLGFDTLTTNTSNHNKKIGIIDIYPNPSSGKLELFFSEDLNKVDNIIIKGLLSEYILTIPINFLNEISILNLKSLDQGIYLIYFYSGRNVIAVKKWIKIN